MHSFHRSRGKIVVEVLCAFGIAASCVGAWMQTGAWAMLSAAAVAAFFGIFHAFDLAGPERPTVAQSPSADLGPARQGDASAKEGPGSPVAAVEQQLTSVNSVEIAQQIDLPAPAARERRVKAPRKSGTRRAVAGKEAKVSELSLAKEAEIAQRVAAGEDDLSAITPPENAEPAEPVTIAEVDHVQLAPLFEPEPFVRQQRAVFGRKAG